MDRAKANNMCQSKKNYIYEPSESEQHITVKKKLYI
jgi:hypothetical protein